MTGAFLSSLGVVALAEIGDKTMLLAILLAARLRAPWQILLGIFAATIANHALAALVGSEIADLLDSFWFRLSVALGFIAMAGWILVPDSIDDDEEQGYHKFGNAFFTTMVAFFFIEMGDKTQIATIALGAQYRDVWAVAAGTTLGMMVANAPAVFLGEKLVERILIKATRIIAALIFVAIGIWQIMEIA